MTTRWEYDVIELSHNIWGTLEHKKLKEHFNTLGRQGWELAGFNASSVAGNPIAIFKRAAA